MRIVVDSYAWIEVFLGSSKGKDARKRIEEADQVFTPDTVLAEVARKYLREGVSVATTAKRLSAISEISELASIGSDSALEAGRAFFELERKSKDEGLEKPSLFDGIVLAMARLRRASVVTGDQHFKGLSETVWLGD